MQNTEPSQTQEQPYLLRKRIKRIEESRDSTKAKSREQAKELKALQKRQQELIENRDSWKTKCKEQNSKNDELSYTLRKVAEQLQVTEEQLREVLDEFNELKKKHHKAPGRPRLRKA
jgi:uncharacterized coiled-coil DUF342 family protein